MSGPAATLPVVPHSLELLAVDASDLGVLIGVAGLVFAFTENRRARRAEQRATEADQRAERAERRDLERIAREREKDAERRQARVELTARPTQNRSDGMIVVRVNARNVGEAVARHVRAWPARLPRLRASQVRTAIARACRAAGVPTFSPHDLRHRRISLLHDQGVSFARIGEALGQRNLAVTANTYTHVLSDGREVDYERVVMG